MVGWCVPQKARQRVPCSQAQGAPAAPSPVSRLGSVAKAPATHDGARRAGGRASAFGRPSGVRAAAAMGTHVNSTRVRGGHSTSHMPAPNACPCPLLPPSSLGHVPPMGWQHPTVPPKTCKPATPCCASPNDPGQVLPYIQLVSFMPKHPARCVDTLWAPLHNPVQLNTLPGPPMCHHYVLPWTHCTPCPLEQPEHSIAGPTALSYRCQTLCQPCPVGAKCHFPSSPASRQRGQPATWRDTARNKGPAVGSSLTLAFWSPTWLAGDAGAELERQG